MFTSQAFKAERMSYPVMTPSAARGLLDSIYWHPGMRWEIERIHVLKPIRYQSIRTAGIKNKMPADSLRKAMEGRGKLPHLDSNDRQVRTLRTSTILRDVHYVIDAHAVILPGTPFDAINLGKVDKIMSKRLIRGACHMQPAFGRRCYPAHFRRWEGGKPPAISLTRDLGIMLYDLDYENGAKPIFFHARLENGVMNVQGEMRYALYDAPSNEKARDQNGGVR